MNHMSTLNHLLPSIYAKASVIKRVRYKQVLARPCCVAPATPPAPSLLPARTPPRPGDSLGTGRVLRPLARIIVKLLQHSTQFSLSLALSPRENLLLTSSPCPPPVLLSWLHAATATGTGTTKAKKQQRSKHKQVQCTYQMVEQEGSW